MARPRAVIFNDTHGWHSEQLSLALHSLGIDIVLTDLAECRIDLSSPTGLIIPGFEDGLPDIAMVRGIAPGFLEQITLRMDVLHTLKELGVPVFNSAIAIEHTVDKARTSLRLHLSNIATPKTWSCENPGQATQIIKTALTESSALVLIPLFGCQGKGVTLIQNLTDFEQAHIVGDTFYLQEYIPPVQKNQWEDWRLLVIDGEVKAGMLRRSSHWITNFAQGATCLPTTITEEMKLLAIAATKAVDADYAGVDLIRDTDGQFLVLEVNSVPAWKGLQQTTGINIAELLAQALNNRILSRQRPHAAC